MNQLKVPGFKFILVLRPPVVDDFFMGEDDAALVALSADTNLSRVVALDE